jgi:hypothetical protein
VNLTLFGRLRVAALIAVLGGAGGSVALVLGAGRSDGERPLVMLITAWVLSPFTALASAHVVSTRWSVPTRATLYSLMLVLTLGSWPSMWVMPRGPPRPPYTLVFP